MASWVKGARQVAASPWVGIVIVALLLASVAGTTVATQEREGARRNAGARFVGVRSASQVDADRGLRSPDLDLEPTLRIELPEYRAPAPTVVPVKGRLQVGVHRELTSARPGHVTGDQLDWRPALGSGFVATVAITSPGASAVRVAIRTDALPDDAELRFYAPDTPDRPFGPYGSDLMVPTASERAAGPDVELFWSPVVEGSTLAIEIWVRDLGDAGAIAFTLPTLSHMTQGPLEERRLSELNSSQGCEKDLACTKKWLTTGDAVAKIIFESGGGTFLCTGTLMNDTDDDTQRLLFITAAHCISKKAEAKSTTFYWFFQRAKCNGPDPTSVEQSSGGANLRYTSKFNSGVETTDTTLMELKKDPPDGVTLAGWSTDGPDEMTGKTVWGIHHPSGDIKKRSKGKITDQVQVVPSSGGGFFIFGGDPLTHHEVVWKNGVTESGSSGSGLFYGKKFPNQFLVGWLSGGRSFCSAPKDPDYYGRFDEAYEVKKFRKFLDPENARIGS